MAVHGEAAARTARRAAENPSAGQVVLRPFARLIDGWGLREIMFAGVAGSVLIGLGSIGAGALPANDPSRLIPVLSLMRHGSAGLHVALAFYYLGLVSVIVAWLLLGRLLLTGSTHGTVALAAPTVEPERVRHIAFAWMTPLLFCMPIASMDLYSYAAQAQISRSGLDPYSFTPADLPGKFLDNVAGNWVDTPSPYGPLWVAVSRWIASVIGDHALVTALILRLLPCAAIVVIAHVLPGIAQRFGKRGDLALWLAVANPLVLVHGVGGGHNDIVMMALGLVGIACVVRPGAGPRDLALGALAATLATAVKFPAIVIAGFIVPLYLMGRSDRRLVTVIKHCLLVLVVAVMTLAAVSWLAGVGLGWTKQVNNAVRVVSFMSIPTMIGIVLRSFVGAEHGPLVDSTVRSARAAGSVVSAFVLVALWWRASFSAASPVRMLAWGLAAVVVLSPAVQPWYFIWALMVAALYVVRARELSWLAALSVGLVLLTTPMGSPVDLAPFIVAAVAAGFGSRALLGPVVIPQATERAASTA